MRLSLKYPAEKVALSWNFTKELGGAKAKSLTVSVRPDKESVVLDEKCVGVLRGEPWIENGVVFQLVGGGVHGADYRFEADVERADGQLFAKVSILPVRDD